MDLHKKYIRKRMYFIINQVISSKSLLLLTALLATMSLPPRPVNRLAAFLRANWATMAATAWSSSVL
jgi:hypothetical protein